MSSYVQGSSSYGGDPAIFTVGNFDGVHQGHRRLIERTVELAREAGVQAGVYTFDPHPRRLLQPTNSPPEIQTLSQRVELMKELGVDVVVVEHFSEQFAQRKPEWFANEVLVARLSAVGLVVGFDFRFGAGRGGNSELLRLILPELPIEEIGPVEVNGVRASSSRIREAVAEGRVEDAAALMGRNFELIGEVVEGDGRGRGLGFPTANLMMEGELRPAHGVYAVRVVRESGERLEGAANLGMRPTFDGRRFSAEIHMLDFSGDLYGERIRVEFVGRVRAERRFESADALVEQVREDVAAVRAMLAAAE